MYSFCIRRVISLVLCICTIDASFAQLRFAEIFSNNMVLQRGKPIVIWGNAKPNELLVGNFANQQSKTKADTAGNWKMTFKAMQANELPQSLVVKSDSAIELKNILVGDVWLCSGQSNIEYPLDKKLKRYAAPKKGIDPSVNELADSLKSKNIRYIYVERTLSKQPKLPTKGWVDASDTTVRYISAIGYFFAKEINTETGVPIGIISSSWGGTKIEEWTPDWAYEQSPVFKDLVTSKNFKINGLHPGQKFNGMIQPLIPLAINGVLWYQGENNCNTNDYELYPEKFKLFVATWRKLFNDQKLPFYYVQIAPCLYTNRLRDNPRVKDEFTLPHFWEAQTKGMSIANTGMVVTADLVDNLNDIHPSYKWVVAHRLAQWAKSKTYSFKNIEFSGPVYKKMKIINNVIELSFEHANGLKSSDGQPLKWFTIAGEDGSFVPATAQITNNKIVVSSTEVKAPKYIRFAWHEAAQPNLINVEGLPALPFRTGL